VVELTSSARERGLSRPQGCLAEAAAGAGLYDAVVGNGPGFGKSGKCSANKRGAMSGAATERTYRGKLAVSLGGAKRIGLSDARRPAYGPKTDMCPIRLATTILVPEEQAPLPQSAFPSSRRGGRSRSARPASRAGYPGGQIIKSGEECPQDRGRVRLVISNGQIDGRRLAFQGTTDD
jgi:hypothetical protein